MARRAAPSPRSRMTTATVSVREWLSGIRLSGFTVIMLALLVLAALVLGPSVSGYIDMRQRIANAEAGVQATEAEIADLQRERDRWQDPAFIMSEARERLFYVEPGQIVYLIEDDLPETDDLDVDPTPIEAEVVEEHDDWMGTMLRSIVGAGTAQQVSAPGDGVFAP